MEQHITFERTSIACPEQYNIYKDDKLYGYVRFRFGELEVHPIKDNEPNWEVNLLNKSINDDLLGVIPDVYRYDWLKESLEKLDKYYESNIRES